MGYYLDKLARAAARQGYKPSTTPDDIDPRERDWREEGFEWMRPETPAGRIFDVLSRPNYAMANMFLEGGRTARDEVDDTPGQALWRLLKAGGRGLGGRDKVFFEDWLDETPATQAWPEWAKTGAGLALDVGLDPTTYLSAGVTKAGKGAKLAAGAGGRLIDVADMTGKSLRKAGKANSAIQRAMQITGKNADELADLWKLGKVGQAESGLRGLLNFGGRPLVSGVAQQRWAERVPYWLAKTPYEDVIQSSKVYSGIERKAPGVRKALSELLSAFTPGDTLDPIVRPIAQRAKRAGMVKEAGLGDLLGELAKPMRKAAEASGDPQAWVRNFMQASERAAATGAPDDMADFLHAYRSFWDEAEKVTKETRESLGLTFKGLKDPNLDYVYHKVNPDGLAELERVGGEQAQKATRKFRQWSTYDPSQQARTIRDHTVIEANDIIMGRIPGKDAADVLGDGFKGYVFKSPLFVEDPLEVAVAKAQSVGRLIRTDEFVKGVKGHLVAETPELIQQGWRTPDLRLAAQWGEGAQIPLRGFVGPRELVDNIEHVWRIANDPRTPSEVIKIYDKVLNTWRGYALLAPSYHVRNTFSNVWQNFLAGVTDPQAYGEALRFQRAVKVRAKDGGKALSEFVLATPFGDRTGVQLFDELFNEDLMGGFMSEWAHEIDQMHQALEFGHKFKKGEESVRRFNMAVGTHIENNARFALYFDQLGKGANPQEAAQAVRKFLFDYTATGLSAFEETKVKRLTSFYRWTKNNMLLSVEQLGKQPGKYAAIPKFKHAIENMTSEGSPTEEFMPEWLAEGYPVRIAGGEVPTYFNLQNWLPAMQIAELFEDIDEHHVPGLSWAMGMMAPTIGIPLEQMMNKSMFFEDEIQQFPGERREFLGQPMSPRLAHILRAVRPLSEANRFTRGTHPGRAASELALGKVYPYDYDKERRTADWRKRERLGEIKAAFKRAVRTGQTREAARLKQLYLETKRTVNVQ